MTTFDQLYNKLAEYSDDINEPENLSELRFANGSISNKPFRLFEEPDGSAWVGIQGDGYNGGIWPVYYTPKEIEGYVNQS